MLTPGELLKISGVLRAVRNMKNYASKDRIEAEQDNVVKELISLFRDKQALRGKNKQLQLLVRKKLQIRQAAH